MSEIYRTFSLERFVVNTFHCDRESQLSYSVSISFKGLASNRDRERELRGRNWNQSRRLGVTDAVGYKGGFGKEESPCETLQRRHMGQLVLEIR